MSKYRKNFHLEALANLESTFLQRTSRCAIIFRCAYNRKQVVRKARWIHQWQTDSRETLSRHLVASALIESLFHSSCFAAIGWMRMQNSMPGLCTSCQLISDDLDKHTRFVAVLYGSVAARVSTEEVISITQAAVSLEKEFMTGEVCPMDRLSGALLIHFVQRHCQLFQMDHIKIFSRNT